MYRDLKYNNTLKKLKKITVDFNEVCLIHIKLLLIYISSSLLICFNNQTFIIISLKVFPQVILPKDLEMYKS